MRPRPKLLIACIGSAVAAAVVAGAAFADEPAASPESGVWQKHEYSFEFMGFTSTYSCDGLADKLQRLLLLSGARADAKARAGACASGFGHPDRFARATLVFQTLSPTIKGADGGDLGTGRWRSVALSTRNPLDLQTGDCELVEQFRDSVLKKMFTVRNIEDHMTCIPHQESGSVIDLRFEAFVPTPGPPAVVAPAPPPQVYAYPKQGQTAAQQAKDRSECEASAATQRDAVAAESAGTASAPPGDAYARALRACLAGRGYSVR